MAKTTYFSKIEAQNVEILKLQVSTRQQKWADQVVIYVNPFAECSMAGKAFGHNTPYTKVWMGLGGSREAIRIQNTLHHSTLNGGCR